MAAVAVDLASPSERVRRHTGLFGIAEAAALAGIGAGARLLVAKRHSQNATCALAASGDAR